MGTTTAFAEWTFKSNEVITGGIHIWSLKDASSGRVHECDKWKKTLQTIGNDAH